MSTPLEHLRESRPPRGALELHLVLLLVALAAERLQVLVPLLPEPLVGEVVDLFGFDAAPGTHPVGQASVPGSAARLGGAWGTPGTRDVGGCTADVDAT